MGKRESSYCLKAEKFSMKILYSDGSFKKYEDLDMEGFLAEIFLTIEYIVKGKEPRVKQLIIEAFPNRV